MFVFLILLVGSSSYAHKEYWIHEKDNMAKLVQLEKAKVALRGAIAGKARAKTEEDLKASLREIQDNYRHLEILRGEYRKDLAHMRFQHPEGYVRYEEKADVRYKALRLNELDDEVKESGVDLALSDVRDHLKKAYDPLPENEDPYKKETTELLVTPPTQPKREKYSF